MGHELVRSILIPEIVKIISAEYNISEDDALDKFYTSKTAILLSDDETGLYGQSALYIFGVYRSEVENINLY